MIFSPPPPPHAGSQLHVLADDFVDMAFGTGAVKITPAHDVNDYECGQRHKLPMISVITKDGMIGDGVEGVN